MSATFVMRYAAHLGLRAPDQPLFRHSARSVDPADQIAFLAEQGFAGPEGERRKYGEERDEQA